jgi:ring-1,2-phenylacetyl-CoA epoxidase subunit PaaD
MDIETALRAHGIEKLSSKPSSRRPGPPIGSAKRAVQRLEEYGIAPPQSRRRPERCPHAARTNLEKISQFGSTPCKAQWRCRDCLEPFDYFKCI